jgi:hypothetical protein
MIIYKQAEGLSGHMIADYRVAFKKLQEYFSADPPFDEITLEQLVNFMAWLQNDYWTEPDGVAYRGRFQLSAKSVRNIHTNLSAQRRTLLTST